MGDLPVNSSVGRKKMSYKYCFVPYCKNTTVSAPEKEFLWVPRNEETRKAWCDAAGVTVKNVKATSYCCEDHFNLQEDLENYMQYKEMGGRKIMKKNVIPRFRFEIASGSHTPDSRNSDPEETCSGDNPTSDPKTNNVVIEKKTKVDNPTLDPEMNDDVTQEKINVDNLTLDPEVGDNATAKENKYVQAKPSTKNVAVMYNVPTRSIGTSCLILATSSDKATKPKIEVVNEREELLNTSSDTICTSISDSSYSANPSSLYTSSLNTDERMMQREYLQKIVYSSYTKIMLRDNPLLFLGISKDSMYMIDLLQQKTGISEKDIFLILQKIRMNLPNTILAHQFGLSEAQVSRIFRKNIFILAEHLKQLIVWPEREDILVNLPIQFRYRYHNVQSIIDCFEIEIEKPSDAVNQSFTWSDYKKCNTAKFLISVTPDGLINFISEGFCGRATDMTIVENSNYLNILPENVSVLADRGFKQLDTHLNKKKCTLIRPPSVASDTKSTKKEVKLTKQIASIRIHVERVIKRIRDFKFLDIHARVDNNLLDCLDSAVNIAAALVNVQSEIIKQT